MILGLPKHPTYISKREDLVEGTAGETGNTLLRDDVESVVLSLGCVVFCVANQPAYISADVTFCLLYSAP